MLRQTENAFRFFVMWTACAAKTAAEKTPSPPQTRQPATENPEHKKRPLSRCVSSADRLKTMLRMRQNFPVFRCTDGECVDTLQKERYNTRKKLWG